MDYTESIVQQNYIGGCLRVLLGEKVVLQRLLSKDAGMIGDNGCKNDAGPYNASRVDIALTGGTPVGSQ